MTTAVIYAQPQTPHGWAATAWEWASTHWVSAAVVVTAAVVAAGAAWAAARRAGRSGSTRADLGFAAVQTGLAYITITGGYEFWHHVIGVPAAESWLNSLIIEACVWASVGRITLHGRSVDPDTGAPSTGFGDAAAFFWLSIIGGGILAVIGSDGPAIALGRVVAVTLGAGMWYLKLRSVTRRSAAPSRWRITPNRLMMAWGWKVAADDDRQQDGLQWQVARLARAMRRQNDGWLLSAWLGRRTLVRHADGTDPAVILAARHRYALGYVLRTEVAPDAATMAAVIDDARRALTVETTPRPAGPPDDAVEQPPPTRQHPVPPPPPPAEPPAAAGEKRAAELWAYTELRAGRVPTGRIVGARFGRGDEWGRLRLNAARERLAREQAAEHAPHGEGVPAGTTAG